ncbi:unnamed protein product, partial [Didymodactylos carnosus]
VTVVDGEAVVDSAALVDATAVVDDAMVVGSAGIVDEGTVVGMLITLDEVEPTIREMSIDNEVASVDEFGLFAERSDRFRK